MARFLVLYRSYPAAEAPAPESATACEDRWTAWEEQAGEAILEPGTPVRSATQIGSLAAGANPGPVIAFSIIQAESMLALVSLLAGHPHLSTPGTSVEAFKIAREPQT
jgi:hypothetical protein